MKVNSNRVAVFRIGHLGDTVVAMPALWTVRKYFASAEIYYLTQQTDDDGKVRSLDVLTPGSVYDRQLLYRVGSVIDQLKTLLRLRMLKIDTLIYLPPVRTDFQLRRDEIFFKLAGVRNIIGLKHYRQVDLRPKAIPLPTLKREADILLDHLAADGVSVEEDHLQLMSLGLSSGERGEALDWLAANGVAAGETIVAVGPGSKMSSKLWKHERFGEVMKRLNSRFAPTFITFGSAAERDICESVLPPGARSLNAAGQLSVRAAAAVLEHARIYLGNDTGTMHLAAASGARCVAIFSARDWPGKWYPYGPGHIVFREYVDCEGCMLEQCDKNNLCLDRISVDKVFNATAKIFREVYAVDQPTADSEQVLVQDTVPVEKRTE